jgi:hypothetical protein
VEDDLWKQCELALDDCHVTLNSLGVLVQKIKETVRVKAWAWRVKAVVNLNVYGADLAAFRDKVHKSNWALQTMLQTINVSLSLRNNASQEAILFELDRLKSSIDEALRASIRPVGGFTHRPADHSDARVARNLRNLAQAARHFHGAASSTASTIRDGSRGGAPRQAYPGADIDVSLMGDLPSFRRERVEEYVREWRRHRRSSSSGLTSPSFSPAGEHSSTSRPRRGSRSPRRPTGTLSPRPLSFSRATESATVPESVTVATVEDDEDDDVEFERLFLDGLEELAKDRIKERDFDKAIEFLQEAMKREVGSKSDNEGFRSLQVQLALCYLLQRRSKMAEPIITSLAKNKAASDAVVCNMLHSMALVHLSLYHFDKALTVCREALMAKKKLLKREKIDADDYSQTQGLLVMIYEMKGDWMHAEVYQSQIPATFTYKHPRDEVEFVTSHPSLLATILGDDVPDLSTPMPKVTPGLYELDGSGYDTCPTAHPTSALKRSHTHNGASPLKLKFAQQLMYEADTSKIAYVPEPASTVDSSPASSCGPSTNGDADDEVSPSTSPEPESPIKRRFSRMFGARRAQQLRSAQAPAPPPVESADIPLRTPIKPASKPGWVHTMIGFKKSKNRLGKPFQDDQSLDHTLGGLGKPKEFKLLYMERMTPENAGQVTDPKYRRQYWSPESVGKSDDSAQEMDAGRDEDSSRGATTSLVALPEDGVRDGNITFKNGVPYVDVTGLRRPRPQLQDVQEEEGYVSDDDTEAEPTQPQPLAELSAELDHRSEPPMLCDPYLCRTDTEVKEYWDTPMRARPTGVKSCNVVLESLTPAAMNFSEIEARAMLMLEDKPRPPTSLETIITPISTSDTQNKGKRTGNARRTPAHPADQLLQSISSVLASLSEISDAEGRHAVKLDLEIMALEFKQRFSDGLVNQDLQRAIDSLENDAITVPRNDNDDSGYESLGSPKEQEEEKPKPRPVTKKAKVPKVKSPFADYARALHDRSEKPKMPANLAVEPCDSPLQPSPNTQSRQSQKNREPRLPLRKRFSFEKGEDEVVDANHAASALRALVESGEADAIQSAIFPSAHTRSGFYEKLKERSSFDGSALGPTAGESPQCLSAKQSRTMSLVEYEGQSCPEWLAAFSEEETVQSSL